MHKRYVWYAWTIIIFFALLIHILYGMQISAIYQKLKLVEKEYEELNERLLKLKQLNCKYDNGEKYE